MRISILCSSTDHPVNKWIEAWRDKHAVDHEISIFRDRAELFGGDLLFLVSCTEIIDRKVRDKYRYTFVLHASDLPRGRGWSPHIWELLGGANQITLSLLNAEDGIDTGSIWAKRTLSIPSHALHDEINAVVFSCEMSLLDDAIDLVSRGLEPEPQDQSIEPTFYRKRTPKDSEIDPYKSIAESFIKIRLMDPVRFPPFFRLYGYTYTIELKKVNENEKNFD